MFPSPTLRTRGVALLLAVCACLAAAPPIQPVAGAAAAGRYFDPTGQILAAQFVDYYDRNGGVAVFGYPIGPAYYDGTVLVQYCERERLEYHPEYAGTPFAVLLGRLGVDLTDGRTDGPFAPVAPPAPGMPVQYVPETQHQVSGAFLAYWQTHGGLTMFGYPISEVFVEDGLQQQWFERARFEYHPELPEAFRVSLGLLGDESLAAQQTPRGTISVSAGPPRPRHLELDLAQGGESHDPSFLHNVVPQIAALHVPLVRIDNIYTHYQVVGRDAAGKLTYNWSGLDQVVDDIRAMGSQPLMCLSYTPAVMSPNGSPIQPPTSLDEWRQLVEATVIHFNRDRGLGIRYWEVWNEPDQWGLWQGSWPDYLQLYDVSLDAIRAVDPAAQVGGPARGQFDASALDWLLGHEQQRGAAGGVDFLSWHAYGLPPVTVADQVGTVRNLLAAHPTLHPSLAITEFNVRTGGANDTSVDHLSDTSAGAAYVLGFLDALDRAGLDRAFLFEVKDGFNAATQYWGRWGILTNDGQPKPVYHAIQAFQALGDTFLPVAVSGPQGLGALAAAPGGVPHLIVWNSSLNPVLAQIAVPDAWQGATFTVTRYDGRHNNPEASGDDRVVPSGERSGAGLIFDLPAGAVFVLTAP